jgi:hypothetical protein
MMKLRNWRIGMDSLWCGREEGLSEGRGGGREVLCSRGRGSGLESYVGVVVVGHDGRAEAACFTEYGTEYKVSFEKYFAFAGGHGTN